MSKNSEMNLTEGSIYKKLIKLSLPIMFSNFMLTFYNLADTFWLGKLKDNAKNAVATAGLAFPLVFFLISFGFGFVVAGVALISRYKGSDQTEKVKRVIGQAILIIISFSVFFLFVSNFFLTDILNLLNTPDAIFELAKNYLRIIFFAMTFMFVFFTYQSISYGIGDTYSPMKIQIFAVIFNVVLDPFMIYGLVWFPKMGTVGAAYATLIARFLGAIFAIYIMIKKMKDYLPSWSDIKPDFEILKKILKISIPASIGRSMTSFGFLFLQGFVNSFGTVVISIYSIGSKMIGFFMMPARGIGSALSSFTGQNIGAEKKNRVYKGVHAALILVTAIMTLGALFMFFYGEFFTKFFIKNQEVIEAGSLMFKIVAIAAWFFGIIFVFNGLFNGAGKTQYVLLLNGSRLWLLRIPLVYILSGKILGYNIFNISFINKIVNFLSNPLKENPYEALWWGMLLSNIITAILAYIIYKKANWNEIEDTD